MIKRKKKRFNKWLRAGLILLATILFIPLLLVILLQLSTVQQYLKERITSYVSYKTGMKTEIGRVKIALPFYYLLEDVSIIDHHNNKMLNASSMGLLFSSIDFKRKIIRVRRLNLKDLYIDQKKYYGEEQDNLSLFISRLSPHKVPEEDHISTPFIIRAKKILISNGVYRSNLKDKNETKPGIDFNNLKTKGINADIRNVSIFKNSYSFRIEHLSFEEETGFKLIALSGLSDITSSSIRLRNISIETNQSAIASNLSFHYQSFDDFKDFNDKVYIRSDFGVSNISTYDLGFFVPTFYLTNNQINMKGSLNGLISNFHTKDFQFSTGSTSFDGLIAMQGLPDFDNTIIRLDINHLISYPEDLKHFHIFTDEGVTSIPLPEMITDLGLISVTGKFNGKYDNFYTNASLVGNFGMIDADMSLTQQKGGFTVNGELDLINVNGGNIINYDDVGFITMHANVDGQGSSESWEINLTSKVTSLDFNGYNYKDITIDGKLIDKMFTGVVDIDDENISLDFNGILNFSTDIPEYNFIAKIRDANPANLNFVNDTLYGLLNASFTIDIQGNKLDNLAGLINIDNADFITENKEYMLEHFDLSIFSSPENNRKLIAIRSDYIDCDIQGRFSFNNILPSLNEFMHQYLPSLTLQQEQPNNLNDIGDYELHFDISFKNTDRITDLFFNERIATKDLKVNGSYSSVNNNILIQSSTSSVSLNNREIQEWNLNITNSEAGLVFGTGAEIVKISDTLNLYDLYWEGNAFNDEIINILTWKLDPMSLVTAGRINNSFSIKDFPALNITFIEGNITIKDTLWQIRQGSGITYAENILDIHNIVFYSHDQSIKIDGRSAAKTEQSINCTFNNIDLSWIDFLTLPHNLDFDGTINGTVSLKNLWNNPLILADLDIDNFVFNDDPVGSVSLLSLWDEQLQGMNLSADIIYHGNIGKRKTAGISGYIFPGRDKKQNFDLDIELDNFRLNILSLFLSDITSDIRGFAGGNLKLSGTFNQPEMFGKLRVNARSLQIDYLNTNYGFADTIVFNKDAILFNNIQLTDNNRLNSRDTYSAYLNGAIYHSGFKDFSLDMNIKATNFTFLNTTGLQDDAYYGRAIATGNIAIKGRVDDIFINVQARTERNTVLEIPLYSSTEVTRSSFITFINIKEEDLILPITPQKVARQSNIMLNFNLQVTPEATVKLIFDPIAGDIIEGNGSGNIDMEIDNMGNFGLRGQYTISKGEYTFNLENLISKKFVVRDGGTIRWTGDPTNALIDLEAVYRTKASLAPLNMEDSARSAQNVDCIIHMTDNLFNPAIEFRIDFPDMSTFENEKYQSLIKNNLNYHFLSLLAINRFVSTGSNQFMEAGASTNIAGVNTTELLSNQLSVWLSNISDEFDVDFAYHPGSGLSPEQVEAAIKTQVLDDRLTIESKVGIGGRTYAGNTQRTSNMVGDIEAEYRVDSEGRIRIKAYNRYNEQNILYEGAPYTQGVGVFYRKEFNSFRELFKRKERERERER